MPWLTPAQSLIAAMIVLVVAILVMNKGDRWFINIKAQDQPMFVAIGSLIMFGSGWLTGFGGRPLYWIILGGLVAAYGIAARYTDRVPRVDIIP